MLDSRPVRTLSHYFVGRYLGLFVAILIASLLSVITVETLISYDELVASQSDSGSALRRIFFRIPARYLPLLTPISAFAAGLLTLGLAARWLELTAAKAGGISPFQFVTPLLLTAALLAAGSFAINESLVTRSTIEFSERQRKEEKLVFRGSGFWYHKGHSIYSISSADPESRTLRGVEVFKRTGSGRLEMNVAAPRVRVDTDGVWHFEDATVRRFDPSRPERAVQLEQGLKLEIPVSTTGDLVLRQASAIGLPLRDLASYVARQIEDARPGTQYHLHRLRTLLHQRMSDPLLIPLFTLLSIPIALRLAPGADLVRAGLTGVVTLACFFLLRRVGTALASEGVVPAGVAAWGALAAFTLWGCWGLLRAARSA